MTIEYSIEYTGSIIEVRLTGIPDRASITQMWTDIVAASEKHHCPLILGMTNLDRPMKLAVAIDHQAIFFEAGVTDKHRIAWVQLNPDAHSMTELAETILLNRGQFNGRLFTDEAEARRWLIPK